MFEVGTEVCIKYRGRIVLGVVTAECGVESYVLVSNGRELIKVNNGELSETGVVYKDYAFANKRQLTLSGKLKGWRNILPREEWWFDDENKD